MRWLTVVACVWLSACAQSDYSERGIDSTDAAPEPDIDAGLDPAATWCGDGTCQPDDGETCTICPGDCGACCGNAACESSLGEDCSSCEEDCGACPPSCGNGTCDPGEGESCATCPADCGGCAPSCGDGACNGSETCSSCSADCGACCGDGTCDAGIGESCSSCASDCGSCCGNGSCEPGLGESCTSCAGDCPALPAPANLAPTATTVSGESVTLDFDVSCGATEYEVALYYDNAGTWTPYYTWTTPNDFKVVWPVLSADFYFQVRAGDGSGFGAWSAPSYFTFVKL